MTINLQHLTSYAGAQIIDASQQRGIVMVMMIVEMGLMNHQSTASLKVGHVLVICSHVIMGTAFLVSISVMAIMIALTTRMKMRGISAVSYLLISDLPC
jgi:hypothetical protein